MITLRMLVTPLGICSTVGLSLVNAIQAMNPTVPMPIVPTVSLAALIGGAISMGVLLKSVRRLEQDKQEMQIQMEKNRHEFAEEIKALRREMLEQERKLERKKS